ncbi:MAG: hypothetical protein ACLT9Y_04045 [Peptostreptococcus anaerobius]
MSKPEKKLQDKAIAYLRKQNIYYINQFGDGFTGKGKPDLVTCINGRFVAFELKVGKNNLQDDQVIHNRRIERSNGLHYAPYTIEEFIEIVEELQNGY